jgi:hypothetical protein
MLDLDLKPDTYKNKQYARLARENLDSATKFVELAQANARQS